MRPTGALLPACHKPVGEAYAARRAATSGTESAGSADSQWFWLAATRARWSSI